MDRKWFWLGGLWLGMVAATATFAHGTLPRPEALLQAFEEAWAGGLLAIVGMQSAWQGGLALASATFPGRLVLAVGPALPGLAVTWAWPQLWGLSPAGAEALRLLVLPLVVLVLVRGIGAQLVQRRNQGWPSDGSRIR